MTYEDRINHALDVALRTEEESAKEIVHLQEKAIREVFVYAFGPSDPIEVEINRYLIRNGYMQGDREDQQHTRRSNCAACAMLAKGVKFRKSPPHTCGK